MRGEKKGYNLGPPKTQLGGSDIVWIASGNTTRHPIFFSILWKSEFVLDSVTKICKEKNIGGKMTGQKSERESVAQRRKSTRL